MKGFPGLPLRVLAGSVALGLAVITTAAWPAAAHPFGGTGVTDAQHAADDLVGTPMSTIERQTTSNARSIADVTGVWPGRRTTAVMQSRTERRSLIAAVNPGVGGQWSGVAPTPVVPVFQAMLPDGQVLAWDSVGTGPTENSNDQSFTRAMVWNPTTNTSVDVRLDGYNIFCAGYTQLADGNVLVAGGNRNRALAGIVATHIFDWRARTWSRGPDMASGRWYPSVAAQADGEALILGGGPTTAEVYQTDNTLRRLTGFSTTSSRLYPFLVPRPDGRVEYVGSEPTMSTIDTSGQGAIDATTARDTILRDYGGFATYDIGKTLVAGGGQITEGDQSNVATKTAVVVSTNAPTTTVKSTDSMSVGRRQHTLTVLADGSVLATGGMTKVTYSNYINLDSGVFAAERWDPATGRWTTLAPASRIRQYHSASILLPDGRVMNGGGGVCGICSTKGYLESNVQYFSPPYLFNSAGQPASRPVISNAPGTIDFNTGFTVSSSRASGIAKVGLVRLGAPTHSEDQGQRYIPLAFTAGSASLSVTAPQNGGIAPPGYYMLFITDTKGVPSVAKIVQVKAGSTPQAHPIQLDGRTVCMDDPRGSTTKGTRPQLYGCNSSAAQQWTARSDGTLRVMGLCLDITASRLTPGTALALWTCKSGASNDNQRFTRDADGLIRSAADRRLCVATAQGASRPVTGLELQTCNVFAAGQRWN